MRRDEPRRLVRLQAGPDRGARPVAPVDERPDVFFGQVGRLRKPDWAFRQRGQSGLWVSDLFPHLAEVADELTVIRSMVAETSNHTPATFQENSGFRLNGFPALGAWLCYGLGSEADDLPAFVVIPDARELPAGGAINWTNGFLPARHQGVVIRSQGRADRRPVPRPADRRRRRRGRARPRSPAMNRRHLRAHGGDDALAARIRGYELAARMQAAVPEVADLDGETGRDAGALRPRPARDGRLRPRLPDRPPAAGARRPVRPALLGRHVRQPAAELGRPRGHEGRTTARRRSGSTGRSPACSATSAAAGCSTTRSSCSPPSSAAPRSPSRPPTSSAQGRDHNQYGFSRLARRRRA